MKSSDRGRAWVLGAWMLAVAGCSGADQDPAPSTCAPDAEPPPFVASTDCYELGPCYRGSYTRPATHYSCAASGFPSALPPSQCAQEVDGTSCCLGPTPDAGAPSVCTEFDRASVACDNATADDGGVPTPVAYSCPIDPLTGLADVSSLAGHTCATDEVNTVQEGQYPSTHDRITCCAN